jgi:hypothetical protein
MNKLPKLNKTWRLVYTTPCGAWTFPVEVEAQSEEEARMRAGMLRFELLNPRRGLWMGARDRRKWVTKEIVEI